MDSFVSRTYAAHRLREGVIHDAIQALGLPTGSRGLDAGCGLGLQAMMLAETVGPAGHITGLDISAEILAYAQDNVDEARLSERISFQEGDVNQLPFENNTFDWAAYQRLCLPESPDFILNQPDYYAFFTYSMFSGLVPD